MKIKATIHNYFAEISKIGFQVSGIFRPLYSSEGVDHRAKAAQLEKEVMTLCGLKLDEDLFIYDVPIQFHGDNYIHTVECGRGNKETLVLLHGFSGSLTLFYAMVKELSQKFHVFCIDFLGMGLSSRPEFTCTTPQETVDYFVQSFDLWREHMKIDQFYFGGHSFGGYFVPVIAKAMKERVKGMYLISPNGVSTFNEDEVSQEWANKLGFFLKTGWMIYFKVFEKLYQRKITPQKLVRDWTSIGEVFIRKYIDGLHNKNKDHAKILSDYLYHMLSIEGGSEQAVHLILRPPRLCAHIPLAEEILPELKDIPTHFYFGGTDWNDWTEAHNLCKDPQYKNFQIEWLEGAGHQMTMQQPEVLTEKILATV